MCRGPGPALVCSGTNKPTGIGGAGRLHLAVGEVLGRHTGLAKRVGPANRGFQSSKDGRFVSRSGGPKGEPQKTAEEEHRPAPSI